jgi:hypothetical protein
VKVGRYSVSDYAFMAVGLTLLAPVFLVFLLCHVSYNLVTTGRFWHD